MELGSQVDSNLEAPAPSAPEAPARAAAAGCETENEETDIW